MSFHTVVATITAVWIPLAVGAQDSLPGPVSPPPPRALPLGQPLMVDRVVAVVGNQPILFTDVMSAVNQRRAAGMRLPSDSAAQIALARDVLGDLIDIEILVQKATELKVEVADAEVNAAVDQQMRRVRTQFASEEEYRRELRAAGFGTPEEYRRTLSEQVRRQILQERAFAQLRTRMRPVGITEAEIEQAFQRARESLARRPATITFHQIVVAPQASAAAKARARAKAESLLVEIRRGGDFEQIARRESMDPATRELGGDLGWNRRGSGLVPEFERVMFAVAPGQVSPVFETSFGYHVLRVDRVQPAEVKARHILIRPVIDSADVAAARDTAQSVAAQWRARAPFETLVTKYHDPTEERGILQPFPRDSLPASYQQAIAGKREGEITDPFTLGDPQRGVKFAILEIVDLVEGGEYSIAEVREQIRSQLQSERSARLLLDELRKSTYVAIRL